MATHNNSALWEILKVLFKPHPWHGISMGDHAPEVITCYIEMVPTDTVKYEIEKTTGYLKVDRPQKFSSCCPSLYGLVPQTYCGSRVADMATKRTGRPGLQGDSDPLDICVLTERTISHGDLLLRAVPIGGLAMLDGDEADDKIIAVLEGDAVYGTLKDISECPKVMAQRLMHYFLTYKQMPGDPKVACEITHVYGREEAHQVILASKADYDERFGTLTSLLDATLSISAQ
jgi:inorganic pyrophosphatase